MPEKKKETCATCRFFVLKEKESRTSEIQGNCCRLPPVVDAGYFARFPLVPSNYWCGEYEEKDEA